MRHASRGAVVILVAVATLSPYAFGEVPAPTPPAAARRARAVVYAPGQAVAFAETDASSRNVSRVDVKRVGGDARATWVLPATHPRVRDPKWSEDARQAAQMRVPRPTPPRIAGVGFVVPQLPRGLYEASATRETGRRQTVAFEIAPQLRASEAVVYGAPGAEVAVAVGFVGPVAMPSADGAGHAMVRVPIAIAVTTGSAEVAEGQAAQATTGADGVARFRVKLPASGASEVTATASGFDPVMVKVLTGERPRLADERLQAGDVLLYAGATRLAGATLGEVAAARATYSHAAVFIGRDHDVPMVAEMLGTGHRVSTLRVSLAESYAVDVFRRRGITAEQKQKVGKLAQDYGIEGFDRFASEQLAVLVAADGDPQDEQALRDHAALVDVTAGEKLAMTSAEMVAWAYHDARAPLQIAGFGRAFEAAVVTCDARRYDYTTPNLLARSPSFAFAFALK